jgi:hypothetical protein
LRETGQAWSGEFFASFRDPEQRPEAEEENTIRLGLPTGECLVEKTKLKTDKE